MWIRVGPYALLSLFLLIWSLAFMGEGWCADRHSVVVVHSYHPEFQWVAGYTRALEEDLAGVAELHHVYMDTKRLPRDRFDRQALLALDVINELRPELVILCDDNALRLLGKKVNALGIPVIFLGVNSNPRYYLNDRSMATGVLERPLLRRSVSFAREILGGDVDKCLILFEDSTTSRLIENMILGDEDHLFVSGVLVDMLLSNDPEIWKEMVLAAPRSGYDFLLVGTAHSLIDANGDPVIADEMYRWVASHCELPVFCFWEFSVGGDMSLGGYVTEPDSQGRLAAGLARRYFDGEEIGSIYPLTARQGEFVFSRKALERWGVTLPPRIAERSRFLD